MLLNKLIKRLGFLPRTIEKSELEDLLNTMMAEGRDNTLESLAVLKSLDDKAFNKKAISFLYGKLGRARTPSEVITQLTKVNNELFSKEHTIKKMLEDLPEVIITTQMTTKVSSIVSMVNDLSTFINFQMDFFYLLVNDKDNEDDYSNKKIKSMWEGVPAYISILLFVINIENELTSLNNLDNYVIINEDNKMSKALLSDSGHMNLPENNLIDTIYAIRIWFVDMEIKKYQILKEKKSLLEVKVLDLKKRLANDPTDVKLKRAISVFIEDIEKTEYRIKKIES